MKTFTKYPFATTFILSLFLFLGIILRSQNFNLLPIDGHAMRQTDTESVAYNFAFRNHNLLFPQNSFIRPTTNKEGYFFLEFPIYQYIIGIGYIIFGWHIQVARVINLLFFITAFYNLYYFVKQYFNNRVALFTLLFFTFSPSSIFFIGHAIHPDVFSLAMMTVALSSYLRWHKKKKVYWFIISCLSLSLSVATRPFALLVLPAFFFMMWDLKAYIWEYPFLALSSVSVYGGWYLWTKRFKELADHSWENWVLERRADFFQKDVILHTMIQKNLAGEVLGKFASLFVTLGILLIPVIKQRRLLFLLFWIAGIPIYWYLVPQGNWFHQYYANVYLIPLLIVGGVGASSLTRYLEKAKQTKFLVLPIVLFISVMTLYNGYRTSSYFFNDLIPQEDVQIAKEINEYVPKDSRLLYLEVLNSVPLSLYHRKGWVLGAYPVDVAQDAGIIMSLKEYGLEYIVESKRSPTLPKEEMDKLLPHLVPVHSSSVCTIYRVK